MEIALRTAGVLLPNIPQEEERFTLLPRDLTIQQQVQARLERLAKAARNNSDSQEDMWMNGL